MKPYLSEEARRLTVEAETQQVMLERLRMEMARIGVGVDEFGAYKLPEQPISEEAAAHAQNEALTMILDIAAGMNEHPEADPALQVSVLKFAAMRIKHIAALALELRWNQRFQQTSVTTGSAEGASS